MNIEKKSFTLEMIDINSLNHRFSRLEEGQSRLENKLQELVFFRLEEGQSRLENKLQELIREQKSALERIGEMETQLRSLEQGQQDILSRTSKITADTEMEAKLSQLKREIIDLQNERLEEINAKLNQIVKNVK